MKAIIALAALQQGGLMENDRDEAASIVREELYDGANREATALGLARRIDELRSALESARADSARERGDEAALANLVLVGFKNSEYIPAIRAIRRATGCGLREAKLAADRVRDIVPVSGSN